MKHNLIPQKFLDKFRNLILQHIALYPKLSLKAEQFEALFSLATNSYWVPNNHNPNGDMVTTLPGLEEPSLKSGILEGDYLTFSSHRTTKHKTLVDKINFLNSRDYDSYVCLARPKNKTHIYSLIHFPKSTINFETLMYSETKNKNGEFSGWVATNENQTIKVKIVKSMSDQVWIEIHKSLITIIDSYDYEVTE